MKKLLYPLLVSKIELLRAEGGVSEQELNQIVAENLETKSCAEFGCGGVYLD
jgi:hypothetical protein